MQKSEQEIWNLSMIQMFEEPKNLEIIQNLSKTTNKKLKNELSNFYDL